MAGTDRTRARPGIRSPFSLPLTSPSGSVKIRDAHSRFASLAQQLDNFLNQTPALINQSPGINQHSLQLNQLLNASAARHPNSTHARNAAILQRFTNALRLCPGGCYPSKVLNQIETDLLNASEVAALLRVHLKTIYLLAGAGRLPVIRIGRTVRFPKAAIERLLQTRSPLVEGMTSGQLSNAPQIDPGEF